MEKYVGGLEFTVPSPLAQVAGDDESCRLERWKELLQGLDLLEVGEAAEVDVGKMDDSDEAGTHLASEEYDFTR
jgi:hypothetical protein